MSTQTLITGAQFAHLPAHETEDCELVEANEVFIYANEDVRMLRRSAKLTSALLPASNFPYPKSWTR